MNLASRMETSALRDRIQVTRAVRDRLAGRSRFERRDPVPIKGKGLLEAWLLVHEESSDPGPEHGPGRPPGGTS